MGKRGDFLRIKSTFSFLQGSEKPILLKCGLQSVAARSQWDSCPLPIFIMSKCLRADGNSSVLLAGSLSDSFVSCVSRSAGPRGGLEEPWFCNGTGEKGSGQLQGLLGKRWEETKGILEAAPSPSVATKCYPFATPLTHPAQCCLPLSPPPLLTMLSWTWGPCRV